MYTKHPAVYLEQYAGASGLRGMSPAFKAAFSLAVLFLCLVLDRPAVSVFVIVTMGAASVIGSKIKLSAYIKLLGIPLFFIVFGGIALIFTTKDYLLAITVTLRAMGGVSAFYFLLLSTPVHEIIGVLRRCRIPKLFIELMYLIYRFIFVLLDVWHAMNTAAQSRLGFADYRTSLRSFGAIAGNLLVLSMKRADAFYNAMEARCYDGVLGFLEKQYTVKAKELMAAVIYLGLLLAVGRIWR